MSKKLNKGNTTNPAEKDKIALDKTESAQSNDKQTVWVANGAGNQPFEVAWHPGDTVGKILERAQIEIPEGRTVTLGQRRVRSMNTPIKSGETMVIAGLPRNG